MSQWWRIFSKQTRPAIASAVSADAAFKELSFTFCVIALAARIARAGGELSPAKYVAFREAFPLSGGVCGRIRSLFTLACEDPTPFDRYVTQVKTIFPQRKALFVSLVDRLFTIAAADGRILREAERMLAQIAHGLGVSAAQYTALRDHHLRPRPPHQILGVQKRARGAALKNRYRELIRRWHPDRFPRHELSPEVEMLLQLKASEINAAYRSLTKKAA